MMPKNDRPATDVAPPPDPTDIEATPLSLRNPDLAPDPSSAPQGHPVSVAINTDGLDNNYASNGHWDRDDIGPVSYVPPIEAQAGTSPRAAGQAPAQQGGPAPRTDPGKDRT